MNPTLLPITIKFNDKAFRLPPAMKPYVAEIFHHEYALLLPLEDTRAFVPNLPKQPIILDIGANVGAFSVYAQAAYGCDAIHAYEPNPDAFRLLVDNLKTHALPAVVHNLAVRREPGECKLYLGKHNLGESSVHCGKEQSDEYVTVECVAASTLPAAHIIKIDTEGCEVEILCGLDLSLCQILMYEWHSEEDRRTLTAYLEPNFQLFSGYQRNPREGVDRWRRRHPHNAVV